MVESIDLSSMDKKEKILLMEKLWNDLINNGDFESPLWHKMILSEREEKLKNGDEKAINWEEAKKSLKE